MKEKTQLEQRCEALQQADKAAEQREASIRHSLDTKHSAERQHWVQEKEQLVEKYERQRSEVRRLEKESESLPAPSPKEGKIMTLRHIEERQEWMSLHHYIEERQEWIRQREELERQQLLERQQVQADRARVATLVENYEGELGTMRGSQKALQAELDAARGSEQVLRGAVEHAADTLMEVLTLTTVPAPLHHTAAYISTTIVPISIRVI